MKLTMLAAVLTTSALVTASAALAGNSITFSPAAPTTTSGVSFTVSTGGGNRDFASVSVSCDNGYATVLTVEVPAKGTGTSQTIYPPAGNCVANLEKLMSITHSRVLATVSFTVT